MWHTIKRDNLHVYRNLLGNRLCLKPSSAACCRQQWHLNQVMASLLGFDKSSGYSTMGVVTPQISGVYNGRGMQAWLHTVVLLSSMLTVQFVWFQQANVQPAVGCARSIAVVAWQPERVSSRRTEHVGMTGPTSFTPRGGRLRRSMLFCHGLSQLVCSECIAARAVAARICAQGTLKQQMLDAVTRAEQRQLPEGHDRARIQCGCG
jgi:hypothetical protein